MGIVLELPNRDKIDMNFDYLKKQRETLFHNSLFNIYIKKMYLYKNLF